MVQLDGRPMSGDIGAGATKAAVALAAIVAASEARPPGLISLEICTSCISFSSFISSSKVVTETVVCLGCRNSNGRDDASWTVHDYRKLYYTLY